MWARPSPVRFGSSLCVGSFGYGGGSVLVFTRAGHEFLRQPRMGRKVKTDEVDRIPCMYVWMSCPPFCSYVCLSVCLLCTVFLYVILSVCVDVSGCLTGWLAVRKEIRVVSSRSMFALLMDDDFLTLGHLLAHELLLLLLTTSCRESVWIPWTGFSRM